jgi:hypothetical protein
MKEYKAVLDVAARTVHLESPTHDSVILKLPSPTSIASALHHTMAKTAVSTECSANRTLCIVGQIVYPPSSHKLYRVFILY